MNIPEIPSCRCNILTNTIFCQPHTCKCKHMVHSCTLPGVPCSNTPYLQRISTGATCAQFSQFWYAPAGEGGCTKSWCAFWPSMFQMPPVIRLLRSPTQLRGHTQMGIPFLFASFVYWKMVTYQNVTPESLCDGFIQNSDSREIRIELETSDLWSFKK